MSHEASGEARQDVTRLLHEWSHGSAEAFEQLLPLVYDELKRVARGNLRFEREGHTLNTTALVHEAYVRLVDQDRVEWQSRSHFFAVASQAMRRILIDYARKRKALRRGGGAHHASLDAAADVPAGQQLFTDEQAVELIALDEALERLAEFNPRGAQVVGYRYFGGLSYDEIADVLGVSGITVRRAWMAAKVWLRKEIGNDIQLG